VTLSLRLALVPRSAYCHWMRGLVKGIQQNLEGNRPYGRTSLLGMGLHCEECYIGPGRFLSGGVLGSAKGGADLSPPVAQLREHLQAVGHGHLAVLSSRGAVPYWPV
jgi:hypothetical protein